jgi:lysophospholipase L1-like esterase
MMIRVFLVTVLAVAGTAALSSRGQAPTAQQAQPPAAAPVESCPELATALQALMRNDMRMRDWPQLARYRDANRTLTAPAAGDKRVVFMGDSITDLWQQQERFGDFFANPSYVDRGISGQTTPQMLIRFKPDVIDLKPKVVVILAGTNDIAGNTGPMTNEEIENNLASMTDLAKAHDIRVVLASVTPVSNYHVGPTGVPQTTSRPMARIHALNEWIKSYAAEHDYVYLDYFSAMTDDSGLLRAELSADDLHPNAKGYAIMGPLAQAAVAKALK